MSDSDDHEIDDDDDGNQSMSQQTTDPLKDEAQQAVARLVEVLKEKHVCPFCGAVRDTSEGACARCTMEDTPATRQATKARIGPWYVFQSRNPAAPGMRWSTLVSLVRKGQITPKTIVRGPTTHQLWKFAYTVKGLSREFGLCYSCSGEIDRVANLCPHCQRLQEPPMNPDVLLEGKPGSAASSSSASRPERASSEISVAPRPERSAAPIQAPRDPNTGFLSAKDLAAAFQLQMPAGAEGAAAAMGADASVATMSPPARKSRRGFKVVVTLLFLTAVAASVVLGINPELRDQVLATLKEKYAQTMANMKPIGDSTERTPPPEEPDPRLPPPDVKPEGTKPDDMASAGTVEIPPVRTSPLDPLAATAVEKTPDAEAPAPEAPEAPAAAVEEPKPAEPAVVEPAKPVETAKAPEPPKPEPKIEVSAPTVPAAKPAEPPVAKADDVKTPPAAAPKDDAKPAPTVVVTEGGADAMEKNVQLARLYWRAAIDAESKQNYAEAVAIYEKIKELPREVWPSSLDINLGWARKQLEGKK